MDRRGTDRGDRGLVTLEWLLIVAAVAALGASTSLIVQRVLDDTSEVPGDPAVRLVDADIAAAVVAAAAQSAFDDPVILYVDADFAGRCDPGVENAFDDVVDSTGWTPPDPGPDGVPGNDDDVKAKCTVTPEPDLGG